MTQEHCHIKGERRAVHPEEEAQARDKARAAYHEAYRTGRGDYSGMRRCLDAALDAYRAELTLQALRRLGVRGTL